MSEVTKLSVEREEISNQLQGLIHKNNELISAVHDKETQFETYNKSLKMVESWFSETIEKIVKIKHDIEIIDMMLKYFVDPQGLSSHNLDRFVNLMISIRQLRLGYKPYADAQGNLIIKYEVPFIFIDLDQSKHKKDVEYASQFLAELIFPLVKDKYMLISVYESLINMHISEIMPEIMARLSQQT